MKVIAIADSDSYLKWAAAFLGTLPGVTERELLLIETPVLPSDNQRAAALAVGGVPPVAAKLLEVTEESLFKAVEQCVAGNRLGDIGHAVQQHVEAAGFSVVRSLVGHGIGRSMHEEPQIPNYGPPGKGIPLEEGMVLAVEPMVTAGRHMVRMGDDGWAIYSQDGSLAAHFEFTIAITAEGPRILTPWHESKAAAAA